MLRRLEAVPRAALRLNVVSDDSRSRMRKVEPGNELEGGRALARIVASGPVPVCCRRLSREQNDDEGREFLTKGGKHGNDTRMTGTDER